MTRRLLLDIEGTTTPISFVHEVLFPYSRLHLNSFLASHKNSTEVIADLTLLREEHATDVKEGKQPPPLIEQYVYWLIDIDRKSPALKSLQGRIWEEGYNDGSLKSPVFADVLPMLQRWQASGIKVNIYSSGSVLAQKLLFSHTNAGDLTGFFSDYFDTAVGKKTDAESYKRIAHLLSAATNEIHFISDVVDELDAAASAGMKTSLCIRPGNRIVKQSKHRVVHSFDQIET